jgi:hypothetical protein
VEILGLGFSSILLSKKDSKFSAVGGGSVGGGADKNIGPRDENARKMNTYTRLLTLEMLGRTTIRPSSLDAEKGYRSDSADCDSIFCGSGGGPKGFGLNVASEGYASSRETGEHEELKSESYKCVVAPPSPAEPAGLKQMQTKLNDTTTRPP